MGTIIYFDDVYSGGYNGTLIINSTGAYIDDPDDWSRQIWTYSGTGTFLGFSTTSGASVPDSGWAVGDTQSVGTGNLYLYSVAQTSFPRTVTVNGATVYTGTTEDAYSVTSTGLSIGGTVVYTYSGSDTFHGFAYSSGASTVGAGLSIGNSGILSDLTASSGVVALYPFITSGGGGGGGDLELTVTYNGSEIASLDEAGTVTLETAGTFLLSDVEIEVSGGGGSSGYIIRVTAPTGSTVTATKDGNTYTATEQSGVWDISVPEEGSYTVTGTLNGATASATVYVPVGPTLDYIDSVLENNSWDNISQASIAGTGDTYWDVGDKKSIVLNGTIGTLALSNFTTYVFILDFNHPINKSTADNNIIWGGFKTSDGKDIALCDSQYGSTGSNGTKYFNMNHRGGSSSPYNTNYGGWKGCDLRYDILGGTSQAPSVYSSTKTTSNVGYDATAATISSPVSNTLMAALPSELRNVLRLWTRHTDNRGMVSGYESDVTATVDAMSLLAEFEIFGARTNANSNEQYHQKHMAYYAAGNSKIKYKQSATTTAVIWWTASIDFNSSYTFCGVSTDGNSTRGGSRGSFGLAPAFKT